MAYLFLSLCGRLLGSWGFDQLGSLFDPLVLCQRTIRNDVMTDLAGDVTNVTPFRRPSILKPKADGTEIARDCEFIEPFDHTFVACIAASF